MEDTAKDETSKKDSPPLQIDPTCLKDTLRTFFQPIKNDDPRLDFYTVYKREAADYDTDYVKKYDEDLNTTLIFAGLFSAVSSAFVIDTYPKLQPDPNEQSTALLRAILLTLNNSTTPYEPLAVPPVQGPPNEIVIATVLLYASLLISLLAAFIAMLGKQWLNRYLRHAGGSMIERCGDRQRKCDGLEKWPFHLFVGSLPVMLQVALLLLACGLCRHMTSVNTPAAYTLIALTGLGVLFYAGIVIAGASSYDCPFQTPASVPLRSLWNKIGPSLIPAAFSTVVALRTLREVVEFHVFCIIVHLPHFGILRHLRSLSERIRLRILRARFFLLPTGSNIRFHSPILPTIREGPLPPTSQEIIPWFSPGELVKIEMKNTNDVRCVSWVVRNITDPEALDAAIRRAGTIRWFDDGIDVEPAYDMIVCTFHACFGSDRMVYPGSRDRAYYSGRAILWIHTLAMCKSRTFPLPTTRYSAPDFFDLQQLLDVIPVKSAKLRFAELFSPHLESTPSHAQWISNVLLHLSWIQISPDSFWIGHHLRSIDKTSIPLDALLNRLLMCCNLLGLPVEEEVLKIRDKSDRLEQVLDKATRTITLALKAPRPRYKYIQDALLYLTRLEDRPWWLAGVAYRWCAVIWENRQACKDWELLLFLSLEVGFRCYDPLENRCFADLTHTEHHRELADAVFKSDRCETIADLLCALNTPSRDEPAVKSFGICKQYIADLHNCLTAPFSPRLRRLVMRSAVLIGYKGFEEAGIERFVGLLNHLHTDAEETGSPDGWASLLLETAESHEGRQYLVVQSWEFLAKLAASTPWGLSFTSYPPCVTSSLLGAQEWGKLECWMGVVWTTWPPDTDDVPEGLEHAMEHLIRQRPGAFLKLAQWMEQWKDNWGKLGFGVAAPASFQRICEQAREAALASLSPDRGSDEESPRPFEPLGSDKFWELLPLV